MMKSELSDVQLFFSSLEELEKIYALQADIDTESVLKSVALFGKVYRNAATVNSHPGDWYEACSSLSTILTRWAHSNSDVTKSQLMRLLYWKAVLPSVYRAGFDNRQRILHRLTSPEKKYQKNFTKLLLLTSINHLNDDIFKVYEHTHEDISFLLAIGWLSERLQMTNNAAKFHQKIVNSFSRFKDIKISHNYFGWVSKAYMYTTYSSSEGKDTIKGVIHNIIRNSIPRRDLGKNINYKKPTLLIFHEILSDRHVMMRIYGKTLELLEKSFNVTHFTFSKDDYTNTSQKLGKIVSSEPDINSVIDNITELSPDILFYPSIGMSTQAIVASSLRLAPIQLQGFGHPSSSHSPVIDGSIHNSHHFTTTGPERYTTYDGYSEGINLPLNLSPLSREIRKSQMSQLTGRLSIAVNAKIMKLCPEFMSFIVDLKLPNNVDLHFYPAESGTEYLACKNFINSFLPEASVHKITTYEAFMQSLSSHDLALCPFPFGNTNGILDCIYLGLPTFALRGTEVCSSSETHLLEAINLSNFVYNDKIALKDGLEQFAYDADFRSEIVSEFQEKADLFKQSNDMDRAQNFVANNFVKWVQSHLDEHAESLK